MNENINTDNKILIKKKRLPSINVKCTAVVFVILLMIFLEYWRNGSYLDEIIGLGSIFYLIFSRQKIQRQDIITISILGSVALIGVLSNLLFGLINSPFAIIVDIIAETKLIFTFFFIKYFLTKKEKETVIDMLTPFSKAYILISTFFGYLSQFVNLGMTGDIRYGIKSFRFIFALNFQHVAVFILVFGVIVCTNRISEKKKIRYYIIGIAGIILSTKAPPIFFSLIFIALAIHFRNHKRLGVVMTVLGLIVLIYTGQYQINEYLLADNSPRRLFFEYSFKTANHYFPLGSGFATFGSDQAARNYSVLYYQYGFDELNGMSPSNPAFLSDTFWPMAIGQFGWIGSFIYIIVYYRLFVSLDDVNFNNQRRAFLYAAFLQYIIHGVGSAILSNSAGMIGFASLAIFASIAENEKQRRSRIHIKL